MNVDRAAFLAQYRSVRDREGYRVGVAEYYRSLPWTPASDPQHAIWAIRQRSFERFRSMVLARFPQSRPRVLDLGAGNGWLSYRLTRDGCRVVAVDIYDDDRDGLGATRHYDAAFPRLLADFDALPFAGRQFDVVVFNGSLHYAPNARATLARAASVVARGGVLAVVDSPMFDCPVAGAAMRRRSVERFQRTFGVAQPIVPGEGFLIFNALQETARGLGFDASFFESQGNLQWTLGRWAGRLRHGIRPPRFGVWWAA